MMNNVRIFWYKEEERESRPTLGEKTGYIDDSLMLGIEYRHSLESST